MSPEICKAENYGPHSDIWALGCIIYEMCAKTPPFNAKTHFDLIQKIKAGRYSDIPACYSSELRKVIASCLQTTPDHRPDTAALLNLPIVKLMRKEQEVVKLGQDLRDQKLLAARREMEASEDLARIRKEIDDQVRREWEVKAQLEIERQVKIQTEQRIQREYAVLQARFEDEVNKRVEQALKKHPGRPSTSPKLAPRSSTPSMPAAEPGPLFPTDAEATVGSGSTSTLGTNSGFASGTDVSSMSLEDSTEDTITEKPKPQKRTRAPLSRARTMFNPPVAAAAPQSPMDIQMAEPSPAPPSLAGLSLSPRRNPQPRQNIFAAAKEGAKKWEADFPPSPTEDEWTRDIFDDDDLPVLPSPTRARSASNGRPRSANDDPFKILANAQRPLVKPNQRLGNGPTLVPNGIKPRPASSVPIVATSPIRTKSKSAENISTSPRKPGFPTKTTPQLGVLPTKRGNEAIRIQAMRNNGGVQGRTLVELQQARGIPVQAMSEDEGKKGFGFGAAFNARKSPIKGRSAGAGTADGPADWTLESDEELPSPFIRRTKNMVR
jgi:hypothetical protein